MKIYQFVRGTEIYFTQDAADVCCKLSEAQVGDIITVLEMTEEDYKAIPTTTDADAFFRA